LLRGSTLAQLVAGAQSAWSIKKGAFWWLSNRVRDGDAQVVVRAVVSPDLL
jgi:phosphohistidine phosphatase